MNDSFLNCESIARKLAPDNKSPSGHDNQWTTRCPVHDDDNFSLSLKVDDGRLLVKCHAGCDQQEVFKQVVESAGIKTDKLEEAVYPYKDAQGNLLFEKVRYYPKDFRIRRPDGNGGHFWNAKSVDTSIVYRLPEVRQAVQDGNDVWIAEGEKDCDNLAQIGLVATCNAFGASEDNKKPKWTKKNTEHLAGLSTAIILPDNDDAGRAHAESIAKSLHAADIKCKIVELPDLPPKGDVSDWLQAGGGVEQLLQLARGVEFWTPDITVPVQTQPTPAMERGFLQDITPPFGYELNENGVFRIKTEKDKTSLIEISGRCWVIAKNQDITRSTWGTAICWIDHDGEQHRMAFPDDRFHEPGNALARELALNGLRIVPGEVPNLLRYLQGFRTNSRFNSVSHIGWIDSLDLIYITPTAILSKTNEEA